MIVADGDGSDSREILNSGPGFINTIRPGAPTVGSTSLVAWENRKDMDLWRIRPDGAGAERLFTGTRYPGCPTPIDEETVLFIAQEQNGAGPWLWAFDLEQRVARRLSFGLEQYTSVAASADGRRLVASIANPRVALWQVSIGDEPVPRVTWGRSNSRRCAPSHHASDPRTCSICPRGVAETGLWRFRNGTSQRDLEGNRDRPCWNRSPCPQTAPRSPSSSGKTGGTCCTC